MEEKVFNLNLRECSNTVFKRELTFWESHGVYYFGQQYAIVCRENSKIMYTFDDLRKIVSDLYVLTNKETDEIVLALYRDNDFVSLKGIKKIVKVFMDYILVEYPSGKKRLCRLDSLEEVAFETLKGYNKKIPYVVIKLPNSKFTLLTKELAVADVEFTTIKEDFKNFVIVNDAIYHSSSVVRLCDLKVSHKYHNILFYGDSNEYVEVHYFSNPPRIMKVSNFETSDWYIKIKYLSKDYALVNKDCYSDEKVLRLRDFSVSDWVKE